MRAGGIVADGVRRPPTAKGTAFLRLETRQGIVDVIVPAELAIQPATRKAFRSAFLVVEGTIRQQGAMTSIAASCLQPL